MKIVGITACPTGIAHTYMAQDALENECKRRGFEYKFETQGAMGPENELSQEDVDSADVCIIAVGVVIEGTERFDDAIVLNADVNDAIGNPAGVVDDALALYESQKA